MRTVLVMCVALVACGSPSASDEPTDVAANSPRSLGAFKIEFTADGMMVTNLAPGEIAPAHHGPPRGDTPMRPPYSEPGALAPAVSIVPPYVFFTETTPGLPGGCAKGLPGPLVRCNRVTVNTTASGCGTSIGVQLTNAPATGFLRLYEAGAFPVQQRTYAIGVAADMLEWTVSGGDGTLGVWYGEWRCL